MEMVEETEAVMEGEIDPLISLPTISPAQFARGSIQSVFFLSSPPEAQFVTEAFILLDEMEENPGGGGFQAVGPNQPVRTTNPVNGLFGKPVSFRCPPFDRFDHPPLAKIQHEPTADTRRFSDSVNGICGSCLGIDHFELANRDRFFRGWHISLTPSHWIHNSRAI